ncbi:MAG: hypothetical protein COA75_10535 [Cellvibrionales bacterium]|nr:MAG: hypothetical protein COA75_10535 [Cellvibrionales bacterium]
METMMTSLSTNTTGLAHKDSPRYEKPRALQEAITQGFASGKAKNIDIQAIKEKAKQQAGYTAR